jgi:hypothetical protein
MSNLFSNPLVPKWAMFLMFVTLIVSSICAYFGVCYHLGPGKDIEAVLASAGLGLLFYFSILGLVNQLLKVRKNGFSYSILLLLTLGSSAGMIVFSGNFMNTHLNYIDEYRTSVKDRFIAVENQIDEYKNKKSGFLVDYHEVIRNSFATLHSNNTYGDLLKPPFNFTRSTLDEVKSLWTSNNKAKKKADDVFKKFKEKVSLCDEVALNQFRLFFDTVNHQILPGSNVNTFDVQLPINLQQYDIYLDNHIQNQFSSLVDCFETNIGVPGLSEKITYRAEMGVWLNVSKDIIESSNYSNDLVCSSILKTADIKIFLIMLVQFLMLITPIMIINQSSISRSGSKGEFEL